ncbi:MAG: ribokinase [Alphaproteobacteria bacterium]|nr:ribokinase [Alphaproteobacteria bacterium]
MIPALLLQAGVPLLARWLGQALGGIEHPAAKAASKALGEVGEAIAAERIDPEQLAAAQCHLEEMAKIDGENYRATLAEVNATARVEAQSDDPYVRRMRPTFGYVMAITWAAQMAAIAWAIVATPKDAAQIVEALGALSLMWSVGLSVLGVYVYKRSADKALAAGATPPEAAIATIAKILKPRKG